MGFQSGDKAGISLLPGADKWQPREEVWAWWDPAGAAATVSGRRWDEQAPEAESIRDCSL